MGVEYLHAIVVRDVNYTKIQPTARNVHAVLKRWGLTNGVPNRFNLKNCKRLWLSEGVDDEFPATVTNVVIEYTFPGDATGVELIFGPSFYPKISADERYLQRIQIVAGLDFKTSRGDDRYFVEISHPAMENGLPVKPDNKLANAYELSFGIDEVIPASASTTPPVAHVKVARPIYADCFDPTFSGVWRAGILFECGKDLPAFIDHDFRLPNRLFVKEIEAAFGSEVCEYGIVY